MFGIEQLTTIFSQHLWLEITPEIQKKAWQESRHHGNTTSRSNAYLNYLCLYTFTPWLQGCLEEDSCLKNGQEAPSTQLDIFQEQSLASLWEVVNGSAIDLEQVRLVLLPQDSGNLEELIVPQEWLDISSWQGDYYLGVEINLEESGLRLWGYANQQKLKRRGNYEESDRTYHLPAQHLKENFNHLLREPQPRIKETTAIQPTLELSTQQAEELLNKLSDRRLHNPRLALDFDHWAALVGSEQWRQELYQRRWHKPVTAIKLREWLHKAADTIEEGWQAVDALLTPLEPIAVRSVTLTRPNHNPQELKSIIELLNRDRPEDVRRQAAGVLGELGAGNSEVVNALEELLQSSQEEETRWQAALSLGKVAPQHPQGGVRKARLVDLGWQVKDQQIALVVALMPRNDETVGVWLELKVAGNTKKLPPGIKIALVVSGEVYKEVTARKDNEAKGDKSLQMRFYPPTGASFEVRISLQETTLVKSFVA